MLSEIQSVFNSQSFPDFELFKQSYNHVNSEKPAIISRGKQYQYRQLFRDILHFRNTYFNNRNLNGERVVFLCPSSYEYVIAQWSIWCSNGIAVPLCTIHPPAEIKYTINDSKASIAIVHKSFSEFFKPILASFPNLKYIEIDDFLEDPSPIIPNITFEPVNKNNGALILYTSGTTGNPKGVVITFKNLENQIGCLIKAWKWTSEDKILHTLPLHHTHGIINVLLCPLWSGATCDMLPKFNVNKVWDLWMDESNNYTLFMAVPTIYAKLIKLYKSFSPILQKKATECCKQFRLMVSGSSSLPNFLFNEWKRISGHTLLERYGMTEIGMAIGNPYNGPRIPGSVGVPFPNVQVKLVCTDTGKDVSNIPETPGEIRIKSPSVFKEYFNRKEQTFESFDEDGWFKTGDIAVITADQKYRILGRASADIIKSGGYKISALEIERELLEHPYIEDCAVVGLPDPNEWGELVGLMYVGSSELSINEIKNFLKPRLAKYKLPRVSCRVNEIPRNTLGKINKREVVRCML
ncbi:putative long chain fatty acid CoA ligase [Piromyces finnis]|uniref:Putative long chain fatty acid CoA ligase n=1 Tax=Piromyces finnis TaxID=1754191 RepID=A0A1Y1VMS7_9FUNG|nr:putative long chain fatty acid CoA ligase [Piromyces finnis]|eukprot:ORX60214.1 putative long chain fatty acid CoA ligase [Piromyces finnis]